MAARLIKRISSGFLAAIVMLAASGTLQGSPYYRDLPGPMEWFETALYWLQDVSGRQDLRDPAAVIEEMQDVAARQFDFSTMAERVGGIRYLRLDLLARSHYQNRLRDRLFAELAVQLGFYDVLLPRFQPLPPLQTAPGRWMLGFWIARRGQLPQRLYFHVQHGPAGWRIVDVSLGGELFSDHSRARF
jgi:hypothetical protein